MSVERHPDSIFCAAIEIECPAERAAFLDDACGDDPQLRQRVDQLLQAHGRASRFLADETETVDQDSMSESTMIGPYKLRERLGAGGMGVVWAAEQLRPVQRKVALKVIKPGMDSEVVIARFEAERQALALMDHPNIARVLDAGTTEQGRPYFVMELIRGIPITEYCDANKLSIAERLELFVQVCKAVQHAHQKGIIHRDIKPSNVLITLHDGVPVPKVIDFGVAKALNQKLTDKTIYTRVHQAIGTLAYMSPEQAELSGLDIDTRADVYGLGVLLYELLTGTTPFEQRRLNQAAYHEACRIIRDEEPPRPSTRLSSLGQTATAVSASRRSDPAKLGAILRGELDWIVMKALEKDRTRRYETASGMAADVQRLLDDEPIVARPPSLAYRFTKFARRNRAAVIASALVLMSLVAGITGTTWMAAHAWQQKTIAEDLLEKGRAILFDNVMMFALAGDVKRTVHELDRATDIELKPGWREFAIAVALTWKGDHEQARKYFAEARVLDGGSYKTEAASIQVIETDAEHAERVRRLREVQPTDPLDFVFQIQVETWLRPKVAIDALENCGRWKTSMFAEHLVGLARVNQALLEQNLNAAEAEIANYDRLLGWFRDNRVPLCAKLYTLIAARNIAYYQGDLERAEMHQISARRVAEALEDASDVFWVARSRAWLFAESGEGTLTLAEWEKRTDPSRRGVDSMHFAACIQLFGSEEERRQAIASLPDAYGASNPHALLAKAYLLAVTNASGDQVAAACDQLLACDNSPEMQCGTIEVWLAYGDAFEARERARAMLEDHARNKNCHWVFVLRYLAGEIEETEFHRHFEAPMFQADARYFEGLKRFANGELSAARKCFEDCRRTGRCLANWYWWSKVFLARIEHNDSGLDAH